MIPLRSQGARRVTLEPARGLVDTDAVRRYRAQRPKHGAVQRAARVTPTQLVTAGISIDQDITADKMREVGRAAYVKLRGATVEVVFNNRASAITLRRDDAKKIIWVFFNSILGTVMQRVDSIALSITLHYQGQIDKGPIWSGWPYTSISL
jgi:hypothetical protein